MRYVRRDGVGRVVALSLEPMDGFEAVPREDPAVLEFEQHAASWSRLRESDLDVVRVLDDLINLLVEKNTIRFTDLPEPAQRKLMERRGLRRGGPHLGLLDDDPALL